MYLVRYLLMGLFAVVVAAAAGIRFYPDTSFIQYVPLTILAGIIATLVLTVVSLWKEDGLTERGKTLLMSLFLLAIMLPSIYSVAAFIHESQTSWSQGEIHWHADFEVIVEGQEIDLIDPETFCQEMATESTYMCSINDRVGITKYHEHDDDRIHVEGVFKTREEATLGAFFNTFQGTLTRDMLRIPTNTDTIYRTNAGGKTLKILVKRGVGGNRGWCAISDDVPVEDQCIDAFTDEHVTSPHDYVISPYQTEQLDNPILDKIFIIYDETPVTDALQDMRADDAYTYNGQTFDITKEGGQD